MPKSRTDGEPMQRDDARTSSHPTQDDEISRRAYERYEERGREHGHDLDDWLEAERDIEDLNKEGR